MTKVKSKVSASPQCITPIMLSITPVISVTLSQRLISIDFTNIAKLYQIAIVNSIINGKYEPGITTSLSSDGSMYHIVAPTAPHKVIKLKILGIHFII